MPKQVLGTYTPESLQAIGNRMRAIAAELDIVADAMGREGLKTIELPYRNEMKRSLESMAKFAHSGRDAYHAVELASGALGEESSGKRTTRKRKGTTR